MSSVVRSIGRRKQRRLGRVEIVSARGFSGAGAQHSGGTDPLTDCAGADAGAGVVGGGGTATGRRALPVQGRRCTGNTPWEQPGQRSSGGSAPGGSCAAGTRRHRRDAAGVLRSAAYGWRARRRVGSRRVLYGISCRDYEAAAQAVPGAIGLSSSTVSRKFIRASAARLKALQERDLSGEDFLVVFLDGKSFAQDALVVALGVTMSGEKRFLGFVETGTENEKVLSPLPRARCSSAVWTSPVGCW